MESDYNELLDWLYGLRRFGIKPGIERVSAAMERLGNPQDRMKIIHVAGTNGKGSVCAMLSSILQKAGYKAGIFTSPHLVDFRERMQVDSKKISKDDVMRIVKTIRATGVELTFFELTTAVALQYFCEQNVDYAVIEVGMGGRFDATNIITPQASVITSLSLDHTQWLGDTIDKIAYEKAGIVKEGVPLFTTVDNKVIRNECTKKHAPFILVDGEENTNMNGFFQRRNAGLAAEIARYLKISDDNIRSGLMHTYWPARLEFIEKNILLDCCHNTDGVEKMAEFVKTLQYDKLIIVFGVMADKDYAGMIKNLPDYDRIILAKPKISRSLDPKELTGLCHDCEIIEDVANAYEEAKKIAGKNDLILICGSCYLAGEILAYKNKIPMHPIMFIQ
ncbi:MAG: bifunctional folylpolyglutamate synthase/dihydrofolate synthase [Candidatus Aenigmarchaeota archaeon]|nr:bifunctional folylpolyglutamate synthase/dihydrofolate synthase [Candidatus Aenigmarchaeota archaeon]